MLSIFVPLALSVFEVGATPVIVEDGKRGRGLAKLRGDECLVLSPAHIISIAARRPDAKVTVISSDGSIGRAEFIEVVGVEELDDIVLLRVVENGERICSDAETARIKSLKSPTLITRLASGGLRFEPVAIVAQDRHTITVRWDPEIADLLQMMSGSVLVENGRERGLLVKTSEEKVGHGEVRNLDYVSGLLGSWVQGTLDELGGIRNAWEILSNSLERMPRGDTGQVRAVERLVQAGLGFGGMDLEGLALRGGSIADADFSSTKLAGADFSQANLERGRFTSANWPFADLSDASAPSANFSRAFLPYANAERVLLEKADLSRSNWFGARLRHANLRNANLQGASLVMADLRGADLRGADLTNTVLFGSVLEGAKVENVIWANTDIGSSVGLPESLGLSYPEACSRRFSGDGSAFHIRILEVSESGSVTDKTFMWVEPPGVPRAQPEHIEPCATVDPEDLIAGDVIYNNEVSRHLQFRVPSRLLQTGRRQRDYIRRLVDHSNFMESEFVSPLYLELGKKRVEAIVRHLNGRIDSLRRPSQVCLNGDTLQLLQASIPGKMAKHKSVGLGHFWEYSAQDRWSYESKAERLSWPRFFPDAFDSRDIPGAVTAVFRSWQEKRAELLAGRFYLCPSGVDQVPPKGFRHISEKRLWDTVSELLPGIPRDRLAVFDVYNERESVAIVYQDSSSAARGKQIQFSRFDFQDGIFILYSRQ